MKKYIYLFCSFLVYFSSSGQAIPYTLEWATYLPNIGARFVNKGVIFEKKGKIYANFIKRPGGTSSNFDFSTWLTANAYANESWSPGYEDFLLVLNSNQDIYYGTYLDPVGDNFRAIISESEDYYAFGKTKWNEGIATTGAHQETFNGNIQVIGGTIEMILDDGYIIKYNAQGQKEWGTYFNGTNGTTEIQSAELRNNILFVGGTTSSTEGFATPNAPITTHISTAGGGSQDSFLAAFTLDGTLLWCTYTHQKYTHQTTNFTHRGRMFIDSHGNIYSKVQSTYNSTMLFSKFNAQGEWITDFTAPNDFDRMFLSTDDKFYFTGTTSSSVGIATLGAYKQTKTFDREHFVVCYDSDMNKLWGTYLGKEVNSPNAGNSDILEVAFDSKHHLTIGFASETPGLASDGAYQSEINGGRDFLLLSLNQNGALNWSTYYGGNSDDSFIHNIGYDENDNLYLYVQLNSWDLATEGALLETPYIESGLSTSLVAKFVPNPDASVAIPETARFQVYPNPVSDCLLIRSGTLDTTITAVEVYDLSGKRVLHPALPPQAQQSIDVSTLASGVYLLKIHNADQSQNVRFVKR